MHRTPTQISLLSLFLKSEPHYKILLDILNKTHVGQDIFVEKFNGIVGNITSSNSIVFTDEETPPEGSSHTRALHIQVLYKNYVRALLKLPVDMSHVRSSIMVVRAFDGSCKEVISDIELPIQIGPCTFNIVFQVMEITPAYSFLLGPPWI